MDTIHNRVSAAKEIKKTLERLWPSVKFSVVSDAFSMGDSINVYWNMGPTSNQVEKIINKYQEGSFDGMTDCYNYDQTLVMTADNQVKALGGAKYVHSSRSYSTPDITETEFKEQFCKDLCTLQNMPFDKGIYSAVFPNDNQSVSDYFWRVFCQTDFTSRIYDGVEYDESENRKEFCKIKTRTITANDLKRWKGIELTEKEALKAKEKEKKDKKDARYKEYREYFIEKMGKDSNYWMSSHGYGFHASHLMARVLRDLAKEGLIKVKHISHDGKKVYVKA